MNALRDRRVWRPFICLWFVATGGLVYAQTASLALSSGATTPGGTLALNLTLAVPAGAAPAGLQWTLTYSTADVTAINISAGPASTAAGKSVTCASKPGLYTCIASGLNLNTISNGVVAVATITLSSSATTTAIGLSNTLGASPAALAIAVSGTGGTIAVQAAVTLSALTCSASTLSSAATTTCTVSLTAPAASGASIALSSNNALLSVPGSVSISPGGQSANFAVTAGTIATVQAATLTASLASRAVNATIQLHAPSATTAGAAPIRVNAGSGSYTDSLGRVWAADNGFSESYSYRTGYAIAGTNDVPLYQSARWRDGGFQYQFTLPNGAYSLTLKFAEIYHTQAGQRKFSVVVNGQTVLADFDIVAAAGAAFTSVDRTFSVNITNGQISIQFLRGSVDEPAINAMEILPVSGAVSVTVNPATATLTASQSQQFTAVVANSSNTAVNWSLSPPTGTISSTGLYTAPAGISAAQQVTVTARSAADSTRFATAVVTLQPPAASVSVNLSPTTATLTASQTRQFTAVVTGSGNTAVNWSLSPSVGTISASGLYTAPSTISAAQQVTVTARSAADSTKFATAVVNLQPPTSGGSTFTPIRVNCGGNRYTDSLGQVWSADTGFSDSYSFFSGYTIAGTNAAPLYQSVRWKYGPFQYQFAVPNGAYTLKLKLAEIYWSLAGQRKFSVRVNGQTVLSNFDIVAAAGGPLIAIDRSFPVDVTNGTILIEFLKGSADEPQVNAIEILAR